MMKKITVLFFILNSHFSSTRQQLRQNLDTEFDINLEVVDRIKVHHFIFSQRLNHFDLKDNRRFNQNYWVSVTHHRKFGPALLYVNGAHPLRTSGGFGFKDTASLYAQKLNAIYFSIEHRFYADTKPENGSIIHHLSIAQALADIANFIKGMTKEFQLPKDTKWIVIGCSYGATLAALSRLRYPDLIHGAVSSSGVLVFKVDYSEYDQIVEDALKWHDPKCVESITLAFEEISRLVDSPQNIANISQMFYLDNSSDITIVKKHIIYIMMDIIDRAVLHNDVQYMTIPVDVQYMTIPVVCRIMTEHKGRKLDAFVEIRRRDIGRSAVYMNMPPKKDQEVQNSMKDYNNMRTWIYQRCSEMGHFSSYTNVTYISPVKHLLTPIEVEIETVCGQFFGPNFSIKNLTERISHANLQYGLLDFNTCNTIFIHGSLDPWHKAGIYNTSTSLYETVFIKGTSHCADIYPPSHRDIPELKNARNKVFKTIQSWLK